MPQASVTPATPIPTPPAVGVRSLFRLQKAKRRWPFALRAALCMGAPVVAGWAMSDTAAGLMATIGAFTALYGNDRPYLNRAGHLAIIAASFAVAVSLGIAVASTPWLAVPVVALIAMAAAFLCNALSVGPPGAYMFTLACAAGTWMGAEHLTAPQAGGLVLAGGAVAWAAHMSGAFLDRRAPERAAVAAAGQAVARYVDTLAIAPQDMARHAAALALHESWTTLVAHQPAEPRPDGRLSHLRALNRELHLLFVAAMTAARRDGDVPASLAERARAIADEAGIAPGGAERTDPHHVPLGHHGVLESLRESLKPHSAPMHIMIRVGVATIAAGAVSAELGMERAYWTIASAVLMLHQGLDWTRTWQRSLERVSGTLVGLLLAAAILAARPDGLWIAATLALLQFAIEMCIVRNYALAVVFITASALTIASGGYDVPAVGHLLWVRGIDTAIGCAVGVTTLFLTGRRRSVVSVSDEIARTLEAAAAVVRWAAAGDVTTWPARRARRDLQRHTIGLLQAYDDNVGGSRRDRETAENLSPAVAATQRLAYRMLAVCWTIESAADGAVWRDTTPSLFGEGREAALVDLLSGLSAAVRTGTAPGPLPCVPAFLHDEFRLLHDSVVSAQGNPPQRTA